MSKIDTSRPPYYNLFNPDKHYIKLLGLPARVEQARELTELQSIFQNQLQNLGDTIYKDGQVLKGCLLTISSTSVTISPGKVYAEGQIITFATPSVVSIVGAGTEVIGIVVNEEIIDEVQDPTLKDPAEGYDNYLQPGCHRLKATWSWQVVSGGNGYGVFTLNNGQLNEIDLPNPKPMTITETTLDIIARRDYEKSGNFLITGMATKLLPHPTDKWNKKHLIIGSGTARILGYDVYMQSDWVDDFPLARDTDEILDEPHGQYDPVYTQYDYAKNTGGAIILGEAPVADVSSISAVFLDTLQMTKGGPVGGGGQDRVVDSLLEIIHVVMGPSTVWDPETVRFTGFISEYTVNVDYIQRGNYIDWSLSGAEPAHGETYHIAFKYIHQCTKEIVEQTKVENETLHHGNSSGNDVLAHPYVCETNDYTEISMSVAKGVTSYVRDLDFVVTSLGKIDWYDYEIQIKQVQRGGSPNTTDALSFSGGWELAQIIDVASYDDLNNANFDYTINQFTAGGDSNFVHYALTSDYLYSTGTDSINWSPSGNEPSAGSGANYVVAVLARTYKTSNHPGIGDAYTATYYYWKRVINGDYLSRDSFYKTWVGVGDSGNEPQVFGLDLRDSVNFWRSYNYGYNYATQDYNFNMRKPYPSEEILVTYTYYLPRYVHVIVDKDNGAGVRLGISSRNPSEPVFDTDTTTLTLARIFCPADSLDMLITEFGVRTLKMEDLNVMRDRIAQTEQNLASTWLDLDAKAVPISNKKGVITTSFANNDRIDAGWPGSQYSLDPAWEQLALSHTDSFYTLQYDPTASTCAAYNRLLTLQPNGAEIISQNDWTKDESIAPYALAGQDELSKAQSSYLVIKPHGDTVIIPRTMSFSTESDADAWAQSDIAKLSNPTQWFSNGWTGGTEQRSVSTGGNGTTQLTTASSNQKETMVSEYMRDILGNCRQIDITWEIPGGLFPTSELEMDFFLYFGGQAVTPILTNGTPSGSVSGSFRPRPLDNGASGTFTIPPNVPEGRVEVKVESTPINYNGTLFKQAVIAVYDAAVVEKLTMTYERCRCNCWCNCVCNCWNCRGRCGTGPLAETIEPVGKERILKSITGYFTKMHSAYGTFGCLVQTDNGTPTSNTVANSMLARKYVSASDMLAARGEVEYLFDDPTYMLDDAYAIVVTGEDGFNLNSLAEIAQGNDIRMKMAELGKLDLATGQIVGSQPFKNGVLFRSLTGVTWEQDQTADLTFKAAFYTYPTGLYHVAYLGSVDVTDVTAFILNWDVTIPDSTGVIFEYQTQATTWTEFQPYQLTYLSKVASRLEFRARMTTSVTSVSPLLAQYAGLYVQSNDTSLMVVTDNFEVDPCDTCDVWLDSHLPDGCTQHIEVTFDNGVTWTTLANASNGLPTGNLIEYQLIDANVNNITYRHHWTVTLSGMDRFTAMRTKIFGDTGGGGTDARLRNIRFSRLVMIASIA